MGFAGQNSMFEKDYEIGCKCHTRTSHEEAHPSSTITQAHLTMKFLHNSWKKWQQMELSMEDSERWWYWRKI